MATIYELQQRADALRKKTETDSINPEEVGGLHADTLSFMAELVRNKSALGIRKAYVSRAAMEADVSPEGTDGLPLRFGQLVIIYDASDRNAADNGLTFAWQAPGWLEIGRLYPNELTDGVLRKLRGEPSAVTDNIRNPYTYLGSFKTWTEVQAELDKLHNTGGKDGTGQPDQTKVGEFRVQLDGRNLIVRNWVQNWATGVFTQTVEGTIRWDGETMQQSLQTATYERTYNSGVGWGAWKTADLGALQEKTDTLQETLTKETTERTEAVNTLQQALDNESRERQETDTALQEALTKETTARTEAEDALQKSLDKESRERQEKDSALEDTSSAALSGATARFAAFVEDAQPETARSEEPGGDIVYIESRKVFAYRTGGKYHSDWQAEGVPAAGLYMNAARTEILKDKTYICDGTLYVWSAEKDSLAKAGGGGSGSGFYNVTHMRPSGSGYYTKETAVAALAGADIEDEDKPGMIITFETAAGVWEEYRFSGTDTSSFLTPDAWDRYGGGGSVKKIKVTKGTEVSELTPDAQGTLSMDIPVTEVEQSVNEESTNAVSGKAVASKIKETAATYGASLKLNEIGDGDDKGYSLSLLNGEGEVISTSDVFTGGGGGAVAATRVVLKRVTPNMTVKYGDEVKLAYSYDQTDTTTGESTGNPGRVTVTITQGANSNTLTQTVAAGSTNTVYVTKYMGVGTNTVRVRVEVGEGAEMQVTQVTWSVNVVQLTLNSSFNIASVTTRGQTLSIPYALSGAGSKTLRCYVDGTDTEDRDIASSTANGSLQVGTAGMGHGTHSVQLVVELELADGSVIRSNSIYFAVAVREDGTDTPLVSARFDYTDGTIIEGGGTPYIATRQYDSYTLQYAVYDPERSPVRAEVYIGERQVSSASVAFTVQKLTLRATGYGEEPCRIVTGGTVYNFRLVAEKSGLDISEPTDGMTLKLSAQGRGNSDTNREEWSYNGIRTVFSGFKWGGDGWMGNALRLTDTARATVQYRPLAQPVQNADNAMAFVIKYRVSEVVDENAEVIRCTDADGTGFVITAQEARMTTRGGSVLSMKMNPGEVHEVAFVSCPKSSDGSSENETANSEMVSLYINGIRSGGVQRAASDSVYQTNPSYIELGAAGATADIYLMRAYSVYLSDSQVLDCHMTDQDSAEETIAMYERNDVTDDSGNVTVDSVPEGMRYVIITGRQPNDVPTVLQAAVDNDKKTKYAVDEILCVVKGHPELNFRVVNATLSLQGTSSLAYPVKNYNMYYFSLTGATTRLYLGCDGQGVGGVLQETPQYSFRLASAGQKQAAPVDRDCLKVDFAESSSSHNTGMARLVHTVLTAAGELTPPQKHCDSGYPYDVRTTIDGEPCYLFYRGSVDETPQFLGKFNFNNDKSSEAVFGFRDIPGYHDQPWVSDKFGGKNPTECWEFLNNDYPMGMFLDDDFDSKGDDGKPNWMKVFEARYPDDDGLNAQYEAGTKKPYYLERLVKWVRSTQDDGAKFKAELADYFDVDYLCDYYMFTDIMGCVDQRVKNMMMAFWYDPDKDKTLAYMIFYDCDTILGVRNDGRLKYDWDVDENTTDPELSTEGKTVYAYAGHDSVLWKNLREQFPDELAAAYRRIRENMPDSTIFNMFDTEQSDRFCERIYNIDALNKYVIPKTVGVEVNRDGSVTNVRYSYLEAMQGRRKAHRHWWVTNRMGLFDARYSAGQYTATDISFKGNSAAGATVRATALRDFYFEFRRESTVMTHDAVGKDREWSYTYGQTANIGTIFHLYGGEWMRMLDLSGWGGFTDLSLPVMPVLEELVLGDKSNTYALTELVLGGKFPLLRRLRMNNYVNLPSLDLSGCNRLEDVDVSGCTSLGSISFAEGAAVSRLRLPENFRTLILRSMQYIAWDAIEFDDKSALTDLWIENCRLIDGLAVFRELLALKGRLRHVRITGVDVEGDGSDLKEWYDSGVGGIDAQGGTTDRRCKLVGTYRLTSWLEEDVLEEYRERFDELDIRQPQYTVIEFDDSVSDSANISNPDNRTGYRYGNKYEPSAHVARILAMRHRVLGKKTASGEVTVCRLDDSCSKRYHDGSAALLNGDEGDVWMFEPHYWYKGVNDLINRKKYAYFSSDEECPVSDAEYVKLTLEELSVRDGYAVRANGDYTSLEEAETEASGYKSCTVGLSGDWRQVRWPSLPSAIYGAVFADASGNILKNVRVTSDDGCVKGMYCFTDVPEDAVSLVFTVMSDAMFDYVLLTKSERIEDIEPDWVEHTECLVGVYEAVMRDDALYSRSGSSPKTGTSYDTFMTYAANRGTGYGLIDYEIHKDVANLFFAKYGDRDSQQRTCGFGNASWLGSTGKTDDTGMQDTFADPDNPGASAAYVWTDETHETKKDIQATCVMGYESWQNNYSEIMDFRRNPRWLSKMPDGSEREIQNSGLAGTLWIRKVMHGRYMDVLPAADGGSSSGYYGDPVQEGTSGFMCMRSRIQGYPLSSTAGLLLLHNTCGPTAVNPFIGTRLAFRGRIKWEDNVGEYKKLAL